MCLLLENMWNILWSIVIYITYYILKIAFLKKIFKIARILICLSAWIYVIYLFLRTFKIIQLFLDRIKAPSENKKTSRKQKSPVNGRQNNFQTNSQTKLPQKAKVDTSIDFLKLIFSFLSIIILIPTKISTIIFKFYKIPKFWGFYLIDFISKIIKWCLLMLCTKDIKLY